MERSDLNPLVDVSAKRRRPLVIAHRGASRETPENTLPAIQRALTLGAQGVEFDVLLTQDKVPVLGHNDDLSILTHHRGWAHATPFATVRALDVGSHFSAATAGITMPTLAEALELLMPHDVTAIVEIKAQPGFSASAAELIGGIAGDFRMHGPLIISSSSLAVLRELARRHPKIPRAFVLKRRAFAFVSSTVVAAWRGLSGIHASLGALTPKLAQRMHRRHAQVFGWTANSAGDIDRCLACGADGIITDDVAQAMGYLGEIFGKA